MFEALKPKSTEVLQHFINLNKDSISDYKVVLYEKSCALLFSSGCATRPGAHAYARILMRDGLPESSRSLLQEDPLGE